MATYEGDLTTDDRRALYQPGWTVYENGIGSTAGFRDSGEEMPAMKWRQVVMVPADDAAEATDLIVAALGRKPAGLRVSPPSPTADE